MKGREIVFSIHRRRILRSSILLLVWAICSVSLMAGEHDEELLTEGWMTTPFEVEFESKEICVEQWMKAPFDMLHAETEPEYEHWMGIPFEGTLTEDVVSIESWMTAPFATGASEGSYFGDVRSTELLR